MRRTARDDDGFILPMVMLIALLIMIGTVTMLGVVTNNSMPARQSQNQETALAAAQSGIQSYIAELNAHCNTYSIQQCSWPSTSTANPLTSSTPDAPAIAGAAYEVTAVNASSFQNYNDYDLRVLATGCVPNCTVGGHSSTQLLADISGVPNVLRWTYFTNVESVDGTLLNSLYPARTIALSGGTVHWPALANGSTCNQPIGTGARSTYVASQTGTTTLAGVSPNLTLPCSVTFSSGMNFTGPVYSADQLYLSNGLPGSTGPVFTIPKPCNPPSVATDCDNLPAASSGASIPSAVYQQTLLGTPAATVSSSAFHNLTLPGDAHDVTPGCTATGSVTIALSGANAGISGSTGGTCGNVTIPVNHKAIVVTGTVYVSGTLNDAAGQTSIVARKAADGSGGDIVITGDVKTTGTTAPNEYHENGYATGSALDLVAERDVILKHDVTCASSTPSGTTAGFCPNDSTGLYTTSQAGSVVNDNGTLKATHPSRQYCNASGDTTCNKGTGPDAACDASTTTSRTVDAAVFALTGSFRTDNYNRGCALGVLNVVGGIYQNHRGPLGQEWEVPSRGASTHAFSGYRLKLDYESLEFAGLPYVPPLEGGTPNHPWLLVSVSTPSKAGP